MWAAVQVLTVGDCIGPEVEAKVAEMKDGQVLLLENTRFYAEESKNDPEFSEKVCTDSRQQS